MLPSWSPARLALFSAALAQPPRATPYMASIASGRAMMRSGPGQTYPGIWLYVRRDLPIRVIRIHGDWRQIQDPDGTAGWMLVSLLSDQRTAIVRGEGLAPMREAPDEASADPLPRRARCGRPGVALRRRLVQLRRRAAARLYPHRPDLGRRSERDDALMDLSREMVLDDFSGRVGKMFNVHVAGQVVPLRLDALQELPGSKRAGRLLPARIHRPAQSAARPGRLPVPDRHRSICHLHRAARPRRAGVRYEAIFY